MKDVERLISRDYLSEYSPTNPPRKGDFVYHEKYGKGEVIKVSKGSAYFKVRYPRRIPRQHTLGKTSTPKRIIDLGFFAKVFETLKPRSKPVEFEIGGKGGRGIRKFGKALKEDLIPLSTLSKKLGTSERKKLIEDKGLKIIKLGRRKFISKEDLQRVLE